MKREMLGERCIANAIYSVKREGHNLQRVARGRQNRPHECGNERAGKGGQVAFDARKEDYQRMSLRFIHSLTGSQPDKVRAFATFAYRLSTDRDSLPQTDADRAFHLVAESTTLIDYELPFATDEAAETIVERAHYLLDEAIALDERCHDALRMRKAAEVTSFEAHYRFLLEHADYVRTCCEEARKNATKDDSPERVQVATHIAMAPYLRWLAALASRALICGRNREALRHVREALELDPTDVGDMRFTAAYAHAKLEDDQGLDQLVKTFASGQTRCMNDCWTLLARAKLAHARRDFVGAQQLIAALVATYPNAVLTLARQDDLPDGVYARIAAVPYSEDELIVAVSEGTILLQEGRDGHDMGVFGSWVLREALRLATPAQKELLGDIIGMLEDGDMP